MGEPPFFSVVISAYNRGEMLRGALESIRSQTFADFECLMVDDGSRDNVPEVLKEFSSADARFRAITNAANVGMNGARNIGLGQARGKWATFLDSDDFWLPERLEAFVRRMKERPEAGFVFSNCFVLRYGRLIGPLFDPRANVPEGSVRGSYAIGDRRFSCVTTNIAITAESFKKWGLFKEGFKATDTELYARFLAHGLPVAVIKEPLAVRRLHEDQITAGHAENFRQSLAAFESAGLAPEEYGRLRAQVAREVALDLVKGGRPGEARALLTGVLGPLAPLTGAWRLTFIPAFVLNALRGLRGLYLRLRHHPLFLNGERRRAWDFIAPLLSKEA